MENKELRYKLWRQEFEEYTPRNLVLISAVERYLRIKARRVDVISPKFEQSYVSTGKQLARIFYAGLIAATVWSLLTSTSDVPQGGLSVDTIETHSRLYSFLYPKNSTDIDKIYLGIQFKH